MNALESLGRTSCLGCALLLGLVAFCAATGVGSKERTFEMDYSATVPGTPGAGPVRVWIPVPQPGPDQDVTDVVVHSDLPYRYARDPVYGNEILYAQGTARNWPVAIGYRCRVTRREHAGSGLVLQPGEVRVLDKLLGDDGKLVVHNARITKALDSAIGGRSLARDEIPRAVYDYVLSTMRYDKSVPGYGQGDSLRACVVGKGNCTDFHSLFLALCRSAGTPAKFAIGFELPEDRREGTIEGYHCWAYFLAAKSGWVPVDASEASRHPQLREFYFGGLTDDRVELAQGRALVLEPPQAGPPLNYFIDPYAEQRDRPIASVTRRVTFHDLIPAR